MRAYLTAVAFVGLVACQAGGPIDDLQSTSQPILGGDALTSDFEGVCGMRVIDPPEDPDNPPVPPNYHYCTCSLVGPDVVLTAARCVWDSRVTHAQIPNENIDVRFGQDLGFETVEPQFVVERTEIHRYFDPGVFTDNIALLVLDSEPSVPMVKLNDRALTDGDIQDIQPDDCYPGGNGDPTVLGCVTLVGFGKTSDDPSGADYSGRRKVVVPLVSVSDRSIMAGTSDRTSCVGDTGGPAFMDFGTGDGLVQVALNAGHVSCLPTAERIRVDPYVTEFIYAFVDQRDPICGADGVCCEDEGTCAPPNDCRTPDPDCDPCAWSGDPADGDHPNCEEDCPTRDWDCPIGSDPGGLCEKDGDCEKKSKCVVAPDDETVSFCAASCDPADEDPCPEKMTCDTSEGDGVCVWVPPSPGSQGHTCSCPGTTDTSCEVTTGVCRSGVCEEEICVIDCDPGAADACPPNYANADEPYTCGPSRVVDRNVCLGEVFSGGGGFCTPSSVALSERGSYGLGALALFGLALGGLFVIRRRRRG